jgi:hypothetical protein
MSDLKIPSGRLCQLSGRSSIKQYLSGLPSMSRRFELFKVVSVRTSQQHIRMLFSIRQVRGFPSKHRYGKTVATVRTTSLHRLDSILDKARHGEELQPSGRQGNTVWTPVLIMEIVCSWSSTVRTLGKHHPDTALFKKECQCFWKAGCIVVRLNGLNSRPDAA